MTRAIITVVGKDTVGIIAKVCTYLADNQINILDISQTIVQEYFNMMMIVDLTKSVKAFDVLSDELTKIGILESLSVKLGCIIGRLEVLHAGMALVVEKYYLGLMFITWPQPPVKSDVDCPLTEVSLWNAPP